MIRLEHAQQDHKEHAGQTGLGKAVASCPHWAGPGDVQAKMESE